MWCALFHRHPFLPNRKIVVTEGECYEVLLSVMTRYEKEEIPVECSMVCLLASTHANDFLGFSERKYDMATMVMYFQILLGAGFNEY